MHQRMTTLLIMVALLGSSQVSAQPPHRANPEQHLARMAEQLDLTADQESAIRALFEEQAARRAAERAAMRTQIDAILSEEQRAKRDGLIDQRIERRLSRMSDGLDLTAEQQDALRAIFSERLVDPSLTRDEMRERIAAVLTEEQLSALESMRPRRHVKAPRGDWMY